MNERDGKLAQWLNEAHVKESELETDLTAHISLTKKPSYKKRLEQHRRETREHKRLVARRIKALGGQASAPGVPVLPGPAGTVAGKAVAAVKGQVGAARAAVTEQAETHMRNAQEELREEHVEIAIYTRIEALAEAVGDRETATLARTIRRDEERMAKYLDAELKRLVKDVVKAEIPPGQRSSAQGRRASSRRSSTKRSGVGSRAGSSTRASSSARGSSSKRRGAASPGRRQSSAARRGASSRRGQSRASASRAA